MRDRAARPSARIEHDCGGKSYYMQQQPSGRQTDDNDVMDLLHMPSGNRRIGPSRAGTGRNAPVDVDETWWKRRGEVVFAAQTWNSHDCPASSTSIGRPPRRPCGDLIRELRWNRRRHQF